MDWFKHSTGSHDDPDIQDARDKFGDFAYSGFFILCELFGQEYSHLNSEGMLHASKAFVRRKVNKSWTKVEQLLNFYSKRNRLKWNYDEADADMIFYTIPKFIELSSNWTRRSKAMPTEAPTELPTAKEVEEEVEREEEDIVPYSDFYLLFPRHEGKAAGEKAWKKIKNKEKPQIIEALQRQIKAKHLNVEDKKYCPLPATWLNGRRWEDDIIPKQDDDEGMSVLCGCGAGFKLKFQGQECQRCQRPYYSEGQRPQEG